MAYDLSVNRIDRTLADLPPGLWPFLAAGDPDLKTTESLLLAFDVLPIRGVELGFPFSDPVADGPVIQAAFTRALAGGTRVADIFGMVSRVRARIQYPILAMVSASIVYRIGLESFVSQAGAAGFDGLIVPDISLEEAPAVAAACERSRLRLSLLVAPTTPVERRRAIAAAASGFLYYVSVQGVTGQRDELPTDLSAQVTETKSETCRPVLVGFGISRAEHVRQVCGFADGAIVGSAIVRRIAALGERGTAQDSIVAEVGSFVGELAGAGQSASS